MQLNNSANPLVSIVITSYNRSAFIKTAIESALAQDYENLEIIISDNNSTDDTNEIIQPFLSNEKIKFFGNEKNIGMIPNFKLATERANGSYITYVSSDDYLINNSFISEAITIVKSYKNILLVFGKNQTLIESGNKIVNNKNTHHLFEKEFMSGTDVFLRFANTKGLGWGATLIHREELLRLNIFDPKSTSLDYEANLLLMLKGNVGFIKTPSYMYRVHSNQASQLKTAKDVINNYSYVLAPYSYALVNNIFAQRIIEKWKNDLVSLESQSILLQFLPAKKSEYYYIINYYRDQHPGVLKKLKGDPKWKLLTFLYNNPKIGMMFFKYLSKGHYQNLKNFLRKE